MQVNATNDPITVNGPSITVVLADNGSAFVDLTLDIVGVAKIDYSENYSGALTKTFPIPSGTYKCYFMANAFLTGALGPTVNSSCTIGATTAATATGAIPDGETNDGDDVVFTLKVL